MTRINLTDFNTDNLDRPLNFRNLGNLTQPINAKNVSVVHFSIPSSSTPIFNLDPAIPNTITLTYRLHSYTQTMALEDRGTGLLIYEIAHLLSMLNTTFKDALAGLDHMIALPTTEYPIVTYDNMTSKFSIIVKSSMYDTTSLDYISITFNRNMWRFFQGMPAISTRIEVPAQPLVTSNVYTLIAKLGPNNEGQYLTNYIRLQQETCSVTNWYYIRIIYLTTIMPIESEIFTSPIKNSGQSSQNILASFIVPVDNGIIDNLTDLNFVSPHDRFRPCKITGTDLYNIQCNVKFQDCVGNDHEFFIGPHTICNVELEFF